MYIDKHAEYGAKSSCVQLFSKNWLWCKMRKCKHTQLHLQCLNPLIMSWTQKNKIKIKTKGWMHVKNRFKTTLHKEHFNRVKFILSLSECVFHAAPSNTFMNGSHVCWEVTIATAWGMSIKNNLNLSHFYRFAYQVYAQFTKKCTVLCLF